MTAATKKVLRNKIQIYIPLIVGLLAIAGTLESRITMKANNESTVKYMAKRYEEKFAEQEEKIKCLENIVMSSKVDVIATKVDNMDKRLNELVENDKQKTKLLYDILTAMR